MDSENTTYERTNRLSQFFVALIDVFIALFFCSALEINGPLITTAFLIIYRFVLLAFAGQTIGMMLLKTKLLNGDLAPLSRKEIVTAAFLCSLMAQLTIMKK